MNLIRIIPFLFIGTLAMAQNEDDALRYSQTFFGGSARNSGMAGAMSAFGGDFSVVTQNPAGLGRFSKSNFSATLNVESLMTNADFNGNLRTDNGMNANLSNLSYVRAYDLTKNKRFKDWYTVQLGMGVTRIKSFNQRIEYSGVADSSILHSFIREAEGTPEENIYDYHPFTAGLAYEVFAIDPLPDGGYSTAFNAGEAIHNRTIVRSGGMTEYSFSLSANYKNKLLLGGSLNFTRVKYDENFTHSESFPDTSVWLNGITYTGDLDIDGWGYGLRVGAIYMPMDWLNVGFSAQLPTLYRMTDLWSNNMISQTDDGPYYTNPEFLPAGKYDYTVRTPFKANGSIGIVLSKFGSIGAEVEYVDYGSAVLNDRRFSSAPYSFINENAQIENIYRSVFNTRVGAELKVTQKMYIRGGFAYYGSPFKEGKGNELTPTLFYTGGVGYNWGLVYADVACVIRNSQEAYYAYDPTIDGSRTDLDFRNAQFRFSLGLRF